MLARGAASRVLAAGAAAAAGRGAAARCAAAVATAGRGSGLRAMPAVTGVRFSSTATKLSTFLQVEIDGEQERVHDQARIEDVIEASPFKIDKVETVDSYVVLRNGNATVEFEATDYEHNDDDTAAIPFEVVIAKESLKQELIFDCIAQYNEGEDHADLLLESIVLKNTDKDEDGYSPSFVELEDDVQESFFDYLHDHGVDVEFARSVIRIAEIKEGNVYRNWLSGVKKFVDSPL